jgi:hypothetical protein
MDSNTLVLVIVLIAVVLALIVSIIALLNAQKALNKCRTERIKDIAQQEVDRYVQFNLNTRIRNSVHDELVRQQMMKDAPKVEEPKPTEKVEIAPKVEAKHEEVAPVVDQEPETKPVEISLPEPVTVYTGICKDGAFKHVTTVPDNKTIFTIFADSKDAVEGILNVDASAYDKIAQTPDYLQNACVYSGAGTQLKVTKTGIVVKDNGAWVIKEPIVAEFN